MKEIIATNSNIVFAQGKEGNVVPLIELIILETEIHYELKGDIVKSPVLTTHRFTIQPKVLQNMIEEFNRIYCDAEEAGAKINQAIEEAAKKKGTV